MNSANETDMTDLHLLDDPEHGIFDSDQMVSFLAFYIAERQTLYTMNSRSWLHTDKVHNILLCCNYSFIVLALQDKLELPKDLWSLFSEEGHFLNEFC